MLRLKRLSNLDNLFSFFDKLHILMRDLVCSILLKKYPATLYHLKFNFDFIMNILLLYKFLCENIKKDNGNLLKDYINTGVLIKKINYQELLHNPNIGTLDLIMICFILDGNLNFEFTSDDVLEL